MTTPKLFLTDYASYNHGKQFEFGHWVELDDFSGAEEFMQYVTDHLKEADEKSPLDEYSIREEPMFTDYEGFPRFLYGESLGTRDVEKIYEYLEHFGDIDDEDDHEWLHLHNTYCRETNRFDDEIYENDEYFFETFFQGSNFDLVQRIFFGDYNFSDEYVRFNGYANLETLHGRDLHDHIDKEAIIEWVLEEGYQYV